MKNTSSRFVLFFCGEKRGGSVCGEAIDFLTLEAVLPRAEFCARKGLERSTGRSPAGELFRVALPAVFLVHTRLFSRGCAFSVVFAADKFLGFGFCRQNSFLVSRSKLVAFCVFFAFLFSLRYECDARASIGSALIFLRQP